MIRTLRLGTSLVLTLCASLLPHDIARGAPGDMGRGERMFQLCYACHSVKWEEKNLPGPNLAGVVGRRAAALPGFDYSQAMRAQARDGLVWTEAALDRYLADPEAMVPGTLMAVNGLPKGQDRADVIAYLKAAGQDERGR